MSTCSVVYLPVVTVLRILSFLVITILYLLPDGGEFYTYAIHWIRFKSNEKSARWRRKHCALAV